jgi:predicted FMN-binding regulatory protein PaiB
MFLEESEGDKGALYAHVARANPQWRTPPIREAMAIFMGPDAYITPSWYVTKQETGKVVPTWNYLAVHAYGPVEFCEDADRLLDVVTRLTAASTGMPQITVSTARRSMVRRESSSAVTEELDCADGSAANMTAKQAASDESAKYLARCLRCSAIHWRMGPGRTAEERCAPNS